MNKLKIIKHVLAILIVIASIILILEPITNAEPVGTKQYFNSFTYGLRPSRKFYCNRYGASHREGTWQAIRNYELRSDDVVQKNREIAYILYQGFKSGNGGYNDSSKYQIALWLANGNNPSVDYDVGRTPEKIQAGRNYYYNEVVPATKKAIPFGGNNDTVLTGNQDVVMDGNVGSIQLNQVQGNVTSMEITLEEIGTGKQQKVTIKSDKSQVDKWIGLYKNKECTTPLKVSDISSKNKKIYIKNLNMNYLIKKVRISAKNGSTNGFKVKVTEWGCLWISERSPSNAQTLISVDGVQEGKETNTHIDFTVKNKVGAIKIIKIGVYNENGEKKTDKNVSASFKLYCNTLKKWVSGNATGNKTYVNTIDKATEYRSNTTVKNLLPTYKYELVEVKVDNPEYNPIKMVGATSNLQKGLTIGKNGEYYSAQGIIVYANNPNEVTVEDERAVGKLKILKVDDKYKDIVLSGAEFIIKKEGAENWIIPNSDGTYNYNGKYEDIVNNKAGVYTTNEQGIAEIDKLEYGTYHIYEIKAPDGYNIEKQEKYDKDNKWIDLGAVTLGGNNTNVTYTVTNKKVVDKLEGNVWLDKPDTKANTYDNIYLKESNDKLLKDIRVYLKDKDKNQVIAETLTDENGHYEFTTKNKYDGEDKNLYYWDLANYYVEFVYDNKLYVVADPFVGNDIKINSKAIEEIMKAEELKDENLTGTDGQLPGRAVTYKGGANLTPKQILDNNESTSKELKTTPLTGYYNKDTYTIEDINLGIKEKHEPSFDVFETLEYIKVNMNGYSYKYQHGEDPVTYSDYVPKAATQTGKMKFSQILYPSDVKYLKEHNEGMDVYVVYSITVSNNETVFVDDIYNEQKLYLNSLINTYDSKRYELCTTNDTEDQYGSEFAKWKENDKKDSASYDIGNGVYKDGIEKGKSITSRIQFKVKKQALIDMLDHYKKNPAGIEYLETAPTTATVNAYHDYLRTDNVWDEKSSAKEYQGIKSKYAEKNDNNETYFAHKSNNADKSSSQLYINLAFGDSRKLSGVVFEDTITDDSETHKIGKLDEDESNRAKNVKVDLLNPNQNELAKLYYVEKSENGVITLDKITTTDEQKIYTNAKGEYTIDGLVPGYYYIRFTYGDGSQKMIDTNGQEIDLTSKDYRSTIIINEYIKKALEEKNIDEAMKIANWYKLMDSRNYSTAVDDLVLRHQIDGYIYTEEKVKDKDGKEVSKIKVTDKDGNVKTDIMNINSYTPMISISIEDDKDETSENNNGKQYNNEFTGFNLGLIKQPDTTIITDKKITNVKFTNQVGTTLVSENPASKQSTYVTSLDNVVDPTGSKNAKLEIEPESIYGSNIELTYEISIENQSAKDFVEDVNDPHFGDYFKYGKSETAKAKKVTVRVLEDDLDSKFNYSSLPSTTTQTTSYTTSSGPNQITIKPVITEKTESDGTKTTTQYLEMTGWESLESGQSTKTSYTVTALIANDDLDTDYRNDAKVKSLSIDTLSTLTTNTLKTWGASNTVFTITPTTGENRNQMYWYISAVALAIVASGIVLIKKKVL